VSVVAVDKLSNCQTDKLLFSGHFETSCQLWRTVSESDTGFLIQGIGSREPQMCDIKRRTFFVVFFNNRMCCYYVFGLVLFSPTLELHCTS